MKEHTIEINQESFTFQDRVKITDIPNDINIYKINTYRELNIGDEVFPGERFFILRKKDNDHTTKYIKYQIDRRNNDR